jgi:glycerol uptake facilitator-like aquaporin
MDLLMIAQIIGGILTAWILFLIAKELIHALKQASHGRKSPKNKID